MKASVDRLVKNLAAELADEPVTAVGGSRPDCWGLIADHGWGDQEPDAIARYR